MAKVAKSALCALSNITSKPNLLLQKSTKNILSLNPEICVNSSSRALSSLSSYKLLSPESCKIPNNKKTSVKFFSSEVDKELSSFLQKEIQYETSKAPKDLPTVRGFEISNDGGDVTLTKNINKEKIVVMLSVNGAVDSMVAPDSPPNPDEPPQMVCRPPFEVEISKGDGSVLAIQCTFPSADEAFEDAQASQDKIEDQFEIQEVAFHKGEWKDTTYAVQAATMDAELFDLLMDLLDERGINDEFISQLVDYCTAYENQQYITFLQSLKGFADK